MESRSFEGSSGALEGDVIGVRIRGRNFGDFG